MKLFTEDKEKEIKEIIISNVKTFWHDSANFSNLKSLFFILLATYLLSDHNHYYHLFMAATIYIAVIFFIWLYATYVESGKKKFNKYVEDKIKSPQSPSPKKKINNLTCTCGRPVAFDQFITDTEKLFLGGPESTVSYECSCGNKYSVNCWFKHENGKKKLINFIKDLNKNEST